MINSGNQSSTIEVAPTGGLIKINPNTPFGSIAYEFMHTLGFMHLHQRYDRNRYVNVLRGGDDYKRKAEG